MNFIIYQATNRVNGNKYIGITGRSLEVRRNEHIWGSIRHKRGCPAFGAAIRKYGPDSFSWKILRRGLSEAQAKAEEIAIIAARKPAYNISVGGDIGCGKARNRPVVCINTCVEYESGVVAAKALGLSQMTVSNICRMGGQTKTGMRFRFADSAEVIRKPRDPAAVEAARESRIAKLKARRHPPETIQRMREAARIRGISQVTREADRQAKRKPIRCVETGQIFGHAEEAAQAIGLKRSSIYALLCVPGKKSGAGFSFEHVR